MTSHIEAVGVIGGSAEDNPYFPFLTALERGILRDPEELARFSDNPIGVDVGNGIIPNSKRAGVVMFAGGLAGVDHVGIEASSKQLVISPTSKDSVDKKGHITQEGAVVINSAEGYVRLVAFARDSTLNPWRFDRLSRQRPQWGMGRLTMFLTGWEFPYDFDVTGITDTDQLIAVQRQRFF